MEHDILVCGRCYAHCTRTAAMRASARSLKVATAVFLALSLGGLACQECPLLLAQGPAAWPASALMLVALAAALPMCWCLWRQLHSVRCPACREGWLGDRSPLHHPRAHGPRAHGAHDAHGGARVDPAAAARRPLRQGAVAGWCMAIAAAMWWANCALSLAGAVAAPPRPQPARERPPWAAADGDDQYGRWADLAIAGQPLRLRWCPPGSFSMGCSGAEMEWAHAWMVRAGDEAPQREWLSDSPAHRVTLTRGFWLADSACTQQLWQAVMGGNPAAFTASATQPVERVSWDDIQRFLAQAQRTAPLALALPSEAQWEYACRAGTTTRFSFGDEVGLLPRFADTADLDFTATHAANPRFPALEQHDGYAETAPVRRFAPNPWGLYDMHGNVQQWCSDWYADYPPASASDPGGPASGRFRVIRGGAWCLPASSCRSAERSWDAPGARRSYVGFRLCVADDPPR